MAKKEKKDEFDLLTPFGPVHIPFPKLPKLEPPKMDERKGKALAHTLAIDISGIIGWIPVLGDIAADVIEDLHFGELRKNLSKPELEEFLKQDKVAPSSIALIRTYMEQTE